MLKQEATIQVSQIQRYQSPCGPCGIGSSDGRLVIVAFHGFVDGRFLRESKCVGTLTPLAHAARGRRANPWLIETPRNNIYIFADSHPTLAHCGLRYYVRVFDHCSEVVGLFILARPVRLASIRADWHARAPLAQCFFWCSLDHDSQTIYDVGNI